MIKSLGDGENVFVFTPISTNSFGLFMRTFSRLLRRPRGPVSGLSHLHCRRQRSSEQAHFPVPERHRLQPRVLHLRLVVQRRLRPGGRRSRKGNKMTIILARAYTGREENSKIPPGHFSQKEKKNSGRNELRFLKALISNEDKQEGGSIIKLDFFLPHFSWKSIWAKEGGGRSRFSYTNG